MHAPCLTRCDLLIVVTPERKCKSFVAMFQIRRLSRRRCLARVRRPSSAALPRSKRVANVANAGMHRYVRHSNLYFRSSHCNANDDGCGVHRFDGTDAQTQAGDLAHGHAMQPQRVRAILRARREHAGERIARVVAGTDLERVAVGEVQPGITMMLSPALAIMSFYFCGPSLECRPALSSSI